MAQITQNKLTIMRRLAESRGDVVRALELKHYSLANREQAFDVAAEILAYQRRLLGSWHASVAAYNKGENLLSDWLAGRDRSEPYKVGQELKSYDRDPYSLRELNKRTGKYENGKWDEMKDYLATIFRVSPDDAPAYRIYDYRDPEPLFRVPRYIPRVGSVLPPRDTKENP